MSNARKVTDRIEELEKLALAAGIDISDEIKKIAAKVAETSDSAKAWQRVELARNPDRPRALDIIANICDDFIELHGDRYFGDDPALIGGIGFINGIPVTIIGNQKGRNLKETMARNGGMANPEGYRKALRLAKQAEKFHRPIITLIDTQGAYPGLGAEERGIGEAIAMNLREFSQLKTPIICVIIGEGGSGGALGIGVGDKVYMLENAVYSVISPEGYASILLRDASQAKQAAGMMKITSEDLLALKVCNGIIKEPTGGAHCDPAASSALIKETIVRDLEDLMPRNPAVLVRYRNQKIRKFGHYSEE
ncbi:MAG TPA: acetyl-CoA carboxylase carboxyltransferase subunit alpha [Treponemataceae bacterium]|nr:acetyl-CoA carboxylase carboxyltransferase subunit alpha [Treponemataceae bacterium]